MTVVMSSQIAARSIGCGYSVPMNPAEPPPQSLVSTLTGDPPERRKRIRRLIVLILLVSIGIHVVAGIGAGIWVIARYLAQPKAQFVVQKKVQMKPQDREHRMKLDEVASLRPKPVFNNRIQSLRPSKLALPELPRVPLETITPIDTEALITDQVDGMGQYGNGDGDGSGGFFGGKGATGSGLLAGNLYDLKRDDQGRDTPMAKEAVVRGNAIVIDPGVQTAYYDVVNKLSRGGSSDTTLRRFYKAPDTLYLSRVAIPSMGADAAPKEFNVAGSVKPRYWVAVYKGRATAPDTGSYRFVGYADDVLLVKIDNRLVFDGSLGNASRLHGKEGTFFKVEKGKAYDIEVIIGEAPGGSFTAWLQIQKQGGEPGWFRMSKDDVSFPRRGAGDNRAGGPTSAANAPVWWPSSRATNSLIGTGL